jgi:CRP-like cAMP-binding protein
MTTTSLFPDFEALGSGTAYADKIREVTPHNALFDEFNVEDLRQLGPFLQVFRAPAHSVIISEGDKGDFMIFIIEGTVDVTKKDHSGVVKRIAVVLPGQALGEMSMIDGEARFASCAAVEPTTFAVLTRPALQELIHHQPRLAGKIMMKLVFMLSQRLRQTSAKLVEYIEK